MTGNHALGYCESRVADLLLSLEEKVGPNATH